MKKNLRIVSAAAAALLAVAPVAAAGVVAPTAVVSAAGAGSQTPAAPTKVTANIGTVMLDRASNTPFSVKLNDTQRSVLAAATGVKGAEIDSIVVASAENKANGEIAQTLVFTLKGHTGSYTTQVTAKFASQQGTPYFYQTKNQTVLNNGDTVSLDTIANGFTPASLLNDVAGEKGIVAATTSDASNDKATITTTASDVESQLIAQGLKRASNGDFDYPANGFNLKLTAKSENGQTATITVRVNSKVNYNAPAFVVNNKVYYSGNIEAKNINNVDNNITINGLDKNGKYSESAVKSAVVAHVQSAYGNNKHATTVEELNNNAATKAVINSSKISVDSSSVKSEPGIYPVVVTATNPAGLTSMITVKVIIMGSEHEAPVQYAKADNTKVYNINGNVVSETTTTLKKDQAVKTYDSVTIGGVQYTQINSENSNQWVKASDLTATKPDTTVPSQPKNIMHNAYFYDKDAKRVGTDKLTRYNSVNVAMSTTTIKGKAYYEVIETGKATGKFINADNIDGTKRTLKHNAYVYKSSKKRANKLVLKKGDTVVTYGGTYTFKNGKQYYKIGDNTHKTYVKASNF